MYSVKLIIIWKFMMCCMHGLYLTMCHVYYHGTFLATWTSSSHACHTHTINEGCVKEIVIIGHK